MFSSPDFSKKQVVFVMANEGEKMAFSNDNLIIKDNTGKVKLQCTCYRLFVIFIIGHISITSVVIQRAYKFGFFIALLTVGFRLYSIVGAAKDGNTLLRQRQYEYNGVDIAKKILSNKMSNQLFEINSIRTKDDYIRESIEKMKRYISKIRATDSLNELMGYEGLCSKVYFSTLFKDFCWQGRQPRVKKDFINSTLDIGYTILFTYIDALLSSFGFDTYYGVMHRQFYMRKSLVCDMVEPFRPLIDHEIKKSINLNQIRGKDFIINNGQFSLRWNESPKYVKLLMNPIINNKENIFMYIQSYYRAFIKNNSIEQYPNFLLRD